MSRMRAIMLSAESDSTGVVVLLPENGTQEKNLSEQTSADAAIQAIVDLVTMQAAEKLASEKPDLPKNDAQRLLREFAGSVHESAKNLFAAMAVL